MSPQQESALKCAEHGWPVFPCWPNSKNPLTRHGLKDATLDPAVIERWWSVWPTANFAIRTGAPSGIVVLDVDGDEGWDSLHRLEDANGELPTTACIVTPRGGEHFYFRHPGPNLTVQTSAG